MGDKAKKRTWIATAQQVRGAAMGMLWEPSAEFVDTGNAPEFFVNEVGKSELLPGGNIRNYMCVKRGNLLIVQYTVVIPVVCFAVMARRALQVSAEFHTLQEMRDLH